MGKPNVRVAGSLVLAWAVLAATSYAIAQQGPTLEEWFHSETGRGEDVEQELESLEKNELSSYFENVVLEAERGRLCDPTTPQEQEWVQRFFLGTKPAFPSADLWALSEANDENRGALEERIGAISSLPADLFEVRENPNTGQFSVFRGGEVSITFEADQKSPVARCLITKSLSMSLVISRSQEGIREQNIASIERAHGRWQAFLKNVTNDQFPWETLANGRIFRGTLARPPSRQLRFVHPQPVMIAPTSDEFTVTPALAIQAIGMQYYHPETYEPRYGLFALFAFKTETDSSDGWGAMLQYQKWSLGVLVRDVGGDTDVVHAVLGIELAQLLQRKKNRLAQLREDWYGTLKEELAGTAPPQGGP